MHVKSLRKSFVSTLNSVKERRISQLKDNFIKECVKSADLDQFFDCVNKESEKAIISFDRDRAFLNELREEMMEI